MSVPVCLPLCPRAYPKTRRPDFTKLPVALAQSSSDDVAIRYVLPFLSMTSYLPVNGQANTTKQGVYSK